MQKVTKKPRRDLERKESETERQRATERDRETERHSSRIDSSSDGSAKTLKPLP